MISTLHEPAGESEVTSAVTHTAALLARQASTWPWRVCCDPRHCDLVIHVNVPWWSQVRHLTLLHYSPLLWPCYVFHQFPSPKSKKHPFTAAFPWPYQPLTQVKQLHPNAPHSNPDRRTALWLSHNLVVLKLCKKRLYNNTHLTLDLSPPLAGGSFHLKPPPIPSLLTGPVHMRPPVYI